MQKQWEGTITAHHAPGGMVPPTSLAVMSCLGRAHSLRQYACASSTGLTAILVMIYAFQRGLVTLSQLATGKYAMNMFSANPDSQKQTAYLQI